VWTAASILLACSVVGCGNTTPTPPATSTQAAVTPPTSQQDVLCDSLRQLGSDVQALLSTDVVAVGANGLNAAVHQVYEQLRVVTRNAGSTFAPQLQALHADLDDLSDTIAGLTDAASIRAALPALTSGLAAVAAGWDTIKRQAADVCP
jgi:hypothetical protein